MDNVTETVRSMPKEPMGFIKYISNFDDENKCEIMNMIQYTLLAIIPVIIILKAIKHYIPEEDESKGSLEILAESIGQILLIVFAIWFTNRIINYIPTYSECPYPKLNATNFMIPLLIILTTMQTKLGAKLNILIDRVLDMWYGNVENEDKTNKQGNNKNQVNTQNSPPISNVHQPSQADYLDHRQILPSNPQLTSMPQQQATQVALQQGPDFNQMYDSQHTPMVNAQNPGIMEPMAANDGMGGFSAW